MSLKLKILRVQAKLTLEDLAQASNLTRSYVSKVERGVSSPSIGAAIKLAKALKVPVEELFGDPSETDPVKITRGVKAAGGGDAPTFRVVAGTSPGLRMLAFVVHPSEIAGRSHPMSHHDGEELMYVLKGAIQLRLADRCEDLVAGDCAHFNSAVPHKMISVGRAPAQVLLVIANAGSEGAPA
jgi:transcriptional regulator with XRE-family HTH domain